MDLNKNTLSSIANKRDRLFSAEHFHQNFTILAAKRAEFEDEITQSIAEIDKLHYRLSKNEGNNNDEKALEEQKRKLFGLKKEMQFLDVIWDEWDDLTEPQLYNMREELFNEIWKLYPNQYDEQKKQWKELQNSLIQISEINKVQNLLLQLQEILLIILQTRAGVKGSGILRYVFGASPNAVIERHLFAAHDYILSIEQELKHGIQQCKSPPLQSLFQEIYNHLDNLKSHCKSVWGFRHIDTKIAESEKKLATTFELLQNYYSDYQLKAIELKKNLDDWLLEI